MRMPNGYKQRRVFICPGIQVFLQVKLGFRVKIHNSFLITLTENNAFTFFKINIRSVKLNQFSDTHAGGIQHIDDGKIPHLLAIVPQFFQILIRKGLQYRCGGFDFSYKTINRIQPSSLTESEATAIKALNGNVYLTRSYTHLLLEKGTVSSGARYDEMLYLDKIADNLQNAAVTLLAENPDRMPQTDDSTAQFINRFTSILSGYTDRGVLASGLWRGADTGPLHAGDTVENGFALWADSYDDQPDADRAAHKAVPVQVGLVLAGSVESIVITVNVMM